MSNTTDNYYDDAEYETTAAGDDYGSSVATLESEDLSQATVSEWAGPICEKCESPLESGVVTICRSCGWYASLGTFVEVDPEWETAMDTSAAAEPVAQKSHVRVLLDLVPRWAWVIVASVGMVIAESVVARFATPADGRVRTVWSLIQLAVGALTVVSCHILNFLALASDDAEIGLLDLLLKPFKLWIQTCRNLPRRLWFFNAAVCGLVGAVMSVLVIGSLPYDHLWDWGAKERPKQNLMGAVMDRAKQLDSGEGADNLEDAVNNFAGDKGLDDAKAAKPVTPKPQEKVDCVILGYQTGLDGRLSTLILGAANRGQLIFAGHVSPKLSDIESSELLRDLKAIATKKPFITIAAEDATWVKPKFTCRVSVAEQTKEGRLREPQWDKMLGSVNAR